MATGAATATSITWRDSDQSLAPDRLFAAIEQEIAEPEADAQFMKVAFTAVGGITAPWTLMLAPTRSCSLSNVNCRTLELTVCAPQQTARAITNTTVCCAALAPPPLDFFRRYGLPAKRSRLRGIYSVPTRSGRRLADGCGFVNAQQVAQPWLAITRSPNNNASPSRPRGSLSS